MENTLVNRVASSGLITLNLENYYPTKEIVVFDIKDYLFMEMILKEKEFRQKLKELDWSVYEDKIVLINCTTDAIIPVWAYMLVASALDGVAATTFSGDMSSYLSHHYQAVIASMDLSEYEGQKIVIKGCSDKEVPPSAYSFLTYRLKSLAQSIMYGEPCSTVPIYKKPRRR